MMSRQEAVQHVLGLEGTVASEFYVYDHERESSRAETHAALRALGVTDAELQQAFDEEFPDQPEALIVMDSPEFKRGQLKAWDDGFGAALLLRDIGRPARNPYLADTPPNGE